MLCLVGSLGSACGMDGEKRLQDMAASSLGLRMRLFLWMDVEGVRLGMDYSCGMED